MTISTRVALIDHVQRMVIIALDTLGSAFQLNWLWITKTGEGPQKQGNNIIFRQISSEHTSFVHVLSQDITMAGYLPTAFSLPFIFNYQELATETTKFGSIKLGEELS